MDMDQLVELLHLNSFKLFLLFGLSFYHKLLQKSKLKISADQKIF